MSKIFALRIRIVYVRYIFENGIDFILIISVR